MMDTANTFQGTVFKSSVFTNIRITNSALRVNMLDERFTTTQIYAEHNTMLDFAPILHSYDPDLGDRTVSQVGT